MIKMSGRNKQRFFVAMRWDGREKCVFCSLSRSMWKNTSKILL